jgi:integrase
MSLYKRGHVYWSAVWIDGVRHMRSLETSNRRQAETLEQRWREDMHTKRFQLPELNPEMSFGELFAKFLGEAEVKAYHLDRSKQFLGFFAEKPIGQITKNDIGRYRQYRHQEHNSHTLNNKPAKPLSETTLNRDIEVIRHVLYWAADEGLLPANPIARIRMVRERRRRRPVMSIEEELKLLPVCARHLRRIVIAALDTGMRRGELLNQRWEHIDFDRRVLAVTHSKTAEGEFREIPLTGRLYELLSADRMPEGLVFTYEDQPLINIKSGWAGALRRAGIPRYRFHDLRHTFNSRLVEAGVIADVRKELMGHSRGGDVHSIYTHVELPLLRDAIHRLDVWHTSQVSALSQSQGDPSPAHSNPNPTQPPEVA